MQNYIADFIGTYILCITILAITFMYYLDNKRTITDLLTFSISQYLAAVLAFITIRIIF